jgi:hypothetical protein
MRDSSVGIARATDWTGLVRFSAVQDFSRLNSFQTASSAYRIVKCQAREADYPLAFSAEVKKGGAKPPLPHMFSWLSA